MELEREHGYLNYLLDLAARQTKVVKPRKRRRATRTDGVSQLVKLLSSSAPEQGVY